MTAATAAEPTSPSRQEAGEVATGLGSDASRGPTEPDAAARLARDGRNELAHEPPIPAWRRVLAQFRDTLTILLLAATAVSIGLWVYERDAALPPEGLVILGIVILNAALGFAQESRAERAVAALSDLAAPQATVVRDGERRRVPAAELVPGDLVLIEEPKPKESTTARLRVPWPLLRLRLELFWAVVDPYGRVPRVARMAVFRAGEHNVCLVGSGRSPRSIGRH